MQLPPGADVIKRRRALVAGIGFGLFMVPNVATWGYLGMSHRESGSAPDYMVVPVIGPFIGIARGQDEFEVMAASVSSVMQLVGLTVFSVGLVRYRSITYWAEAPVAWAVLPRVSSTELGLDLAARY
jgi:hypothetical protein